MYVITTVKKGASFLTYKGYVYIGLLDGSKYLKNLMNGLGWNGMCSSYSTRKELELEKSRVVRVGLGWGGAGEEEK